MFSGARSSSPEGAGSSSSSGRGDRRSDSSVEGEGDQVQGLKLLIADLREQLKIANESNKLQQETTRLILDNMKPGGGDGGAVETLRVRQELEAEIEELQVELASREGLLNEMMDEQKKLQNSVDLWKKRAKSLEEALELEGIDWEQEEDWKKVLDKIKKMKEIKELANRLQNLARDKEDDNLDLENKKKVPPPVVKTMEPPILKTSTGPPSLRGPFSQMNGGSSSGAAAASAGDMDIDIVEELIGFQPEVPKPSTTRIRKPTSKAEEYVRSSKKPRQSDPGRYPCQLCTTSFTKVDTLKNHLLIKHNLGNLKCFEIGCEICGKFLKTEAELAEHMKIAHGHIGNGDGDAADSDNQPGAGPSSGSRSSLWVPAQAASTW